jgi:pilus assembly protein CpaD
MKKHLYPIVVALLTANAGCAPGIAEYSKSEAPTRLRIDGATREVSIAFAPGSARLAVGDGARLDRLVAAGGIRPADRVDIAASGSPGLAEARSAAISRRLLRWGIVADTSPLAGLPPDQAIVTVGRYALTLPRCPNWSMRDPGDFTNAPASNFGCATAVNLGLMVASPADLTGGRTLGAADGKPAVAAVDAYLDGRVQLPTEVSLTPIGSGGGSSSGASSGDGGGQ